MSLITDKYRELNTELHDSNPSYGTSGQKYAHIIAHMMKTYETTSVLDYGCGKRTLECALGKDIANYDPCIPGLDNPPEPHDLVACTDVLEHLEPECLDAVLDDLKRVTKKAAFLAVHTGPAKKFLSDGRNAHIIQEPLSWWKEHLSKRFRIVIAEESGNGFNCVVKPL